MVSYEKRKKEMEKYAVLEIFQKAEKIINDDWNKKIEFHLKSAVTRIRTWVIAATTQCTNHYTITATQWTAPKNCYFNLQSYAISCHASLLVFQLSFPPNMLQVTFSYETLRKLDHDEGKNSLQFVVHLFLKRKPQAITACRDTNKNQIDQEKWQNGIHCKTILKKRKKPSFLLKNMLQSLQSLKKILNGMKRKIKKEKKN